MCALYAHLRKGDCDAILSDLTADAIKRLVDKAGRRDKLCSGFAQSAQADQIVGGITRASAAVSAISATSATVVLTVEDRNHKVDSQAVPLVREGDGWKINQLVA